MLWIWYSQSVVEGKNTTPCGKSAMAMEYPPYYYPPYYTDNSTLKQSRAHLQGNQSWAEVISHLKWMWKKGQFKGPTAPVGERGPTKLGSWGRPHYQPPARIVLVKTDWFSCWSYLPVKSQKAFWWPQNFINQSCCQFHSCDKSDQLVVNQWACLWLFPA